MNFEAARSYLVQHLQKELNPLLRYHCVEHTLDVVEAASRLADLEKVEPPDKILLVTASLFHDAGMSVQYVDHESASVQLAWQILPGFGYMPPEIEEIAALIMVTKLPQQPKSHLEMIMCDADLDYLGRDDFFINSFKLRYEWQLCNIRNTTLAEWFGIQVKFLSEHQYFTPSARTLRDNKKEMNLKEISTLCDRIRVTD